MKHIKAFEDFKEKTLKINNDEYNLYHDYYLKDKDQGKQVMWMAEGSQQRNFDIVSKYIHTDDTLLDYGCGVGDFIVDLNSKDIIVSDYLGVDINEDLIDSAIEKHPEYKYEVITDVNDIKDNYDIVAAIGVFTIYIERDEFIDTINKLAEIANKELLITCNFGKFEDTDYYWKKQYRFYNEDIFDKLFPDFDIEYEYDIDEESDNTLMLVRIKK